MMNKLEDWNEVTNGIFRYVIGAKVCYEIHLMYWKRKTNILSANAKLYIVGDWHGEDGSFFERELLFEGMLMACLGAAMKDNEKNNED